VKDARADYDAADRKITEFHNAHKGEVIAHKGEVIYGDSTAAA
jgi:hypothetical protein